jgi:hypothetical protein
LPRGGKMALAVKGPIGRQSAPGLARRRTKPGLRIDGSALAGFEARLGLVDHVDPALAPDNLVVAMPATQRFQRITDFHNNLIGLEFGRS